MMQNSGEKIGKKKKKCDSLDIIDSIASLTPFLSITRVTHLY